MRRRAWLMMGLASLPLSAQAGDLHYPEPDHVLWRLVNEVWRWADSRPSASPSELALAFLRFSTGCHRFAHGVAIYANSMDDDERAARSGLDELTGAIRHVLRPAERADPEWRAFVDDSPLNAPTVKDWLTTVDAMSTTFDAFLQQAERLEWVAGRMADG